MTAIEISSFGPPEVLRPVDRPMPVPNDREVVIKVAAAGIARADTLQRQGKYPPPPGASDIPGLDVAGTIHSVGKGVTEFALGDAVCAILAGGGYAEYCAAPVQQVLPIPAGWSFTEAATLPENLFTVYDNLVTRAQLTAGETVLIHGGASGIGSMAIMLAQAFGATVITTAGSQQKCDACLTLGASCAINYRELDFVAETKRLTKGSGVDIVLDMVGGSYLERNVAALALEGRIALIATQGGRVGNLDIGVLMMKRGRIMGSTLRARTPDEKGKVAAALLKNIWPLLPAKTTIRPLIDSCYELRDACLAHARMEDGLHIGKIVLRS
jgi:putative PIG3 family NAD(P)H quinone oxidoreductase